MSKVGLQAFLTSGGCYLPLPSGAVVYTLHLSVRPLVQISIHYVFVFGLESSVRPGLCGE